MNSNKWRKRMIVGVAFGWVAFFWVMVVFAFKQITK
jgi:hypothetical protein